MQEQSEAGQWVVVWDPLVRGFHWGMVLLFGVACYTAEWGQNETHFLAGYGISILLLIRIIWGFIGSTHARFRHFFYGPTLTWGYARSLLKGQPRHFLGHNPLGAAMVFVLLALLLVLALSGLLLMATLEFEGPLLPLAPVFSDQQVYWLLRVHRLSEKLILVCVALHLLGVISASHQHRENLVKAMVTGKKLSQTSSQSQQGSTQ